MHLLIKGQSYGLNRAHNNVEVKSVATNQTAIAVIAVVEADVNIMMVIKAAAANKSYGLMIEVVTLVTVQGIGLIFLAIGQTTHLHLGTVVTGAVSAIRDKPHVERSILADQKTPIVDWMDSIAVSKHTIKLATGGSVGRAESGKHESGAESFQHG
jgi:hypothetical protein